MATEEARLELFERQNKEIFTLIFLAVFFKCATKIVKSYILEYGLLNKIMKWAYFRSVNKHA